jgi:hypothetical protein
VQKGVVGPEFQVVLLAADHVVSQGILLGIAGACIEVPSLAFKGGSLEVSLLHARLILTKMVVVGLQVGSTFLGHSAHGVFEAVAVGVNLGSRRSDSGSGSQLKLHFGATGCWLLAKGFWFVATGFWLLVKGFWLLAKGFWLGAEGFWLGAEGYWLLAAG